MRIILIAIIIFSSQFSLSQTRIDSNFRSLHSGPIIPKGFKDISDFFSNSSHYNKSNYDVLSNESRYFIYELFSSGEVLFNEICSNYINDVANYILKDNEELKKELSFFVLKSNSVNAFCTNPGIVFVTTGLLAQVENEAQLAFIIAHEINHHVKNHIKNKFNLKNKIATEEGDFRFTNPDDEIALINSYDKNQEFEADEKAIDILLKSEYDMNEVTKSFEMLLYAYLPYQSSKFSLSFLNTGNLEIPENYVQTDLKPILGIEDYNDELHSHPNLEKRILNATNYIGEKENTGKLKFKISQKKFQEVQLLARLEGINLSLANREYDRVLYNIFTISNEHPNSKFLEISKIKALYGMAVYKNKGLLEDVCKSFEDSEGEISRLNFLLEKLTSEQLSVIAYRHIYDASIKYPNSETIHLYEKQMLKELALHSGITIENLQEFNYDNYTETIKNGVDFDIEDSLKIIEKSNLSKYQKIKAKQSLNALIIDSSLIDQYENKFHLFALADIVSGNSLKQKLLLAIKNEDQESNSVYYYRPSRKKDKGFHLKLKNIVIVSPSISIISNKNKVKTLAISKLRNEILTYYNREYNKLSLEKNVVDLWNLNRTNIDYNQVSIIKRWFNEILSQGDMDIISSSHDQMQEVSKSLGTSHFLFTNIFIDEKTKNNVFLSLSIDANKDQIEFFQINKSKSKLKGKPLEMCIFNTLYQLNR